MSVKFNIKHVAFSCDLDIFRLLTCTNDFSMIYHSPMLSSNGSNVFYFSSAVCFSDTDFTCFRQHITHTSREACGEGCRKERVLIQGALSF